MFECQLFLYFVFVTMSKSTISEVKSWIREFRNATGIISDESILVQKPEPGKTRIILLDRCCSPRIYIDKNPDEIEKKDIEHCREALAHRH